MRKVISTEGPTLGLSRVALRHQPGEGEDADADDAADADRSELPEPEALGEVADLTNESGHKRHPIHQ
jgi:hypothetical protein